MARVVSAFCGGVLIGLAIVFGIALLSSALSGRALAIDEEAFPDAALREQVARAADLDGDGLLSKGELESLRVFRVSDARRVSGLGVFPALEELTVAGELLEEVELTDMPALTSVVVEDAPGLAEVSFESCPGLKLVDLAETRCPAVSFDDATAPSLVRVPEGASVSGVDEGSVVRLSSSEDKNATDDYLSFLVINDTIFETEDYVITVPDSWVGNWSTKQSDIYPNGRQFNYTFPEDVGFGGYSITVLVTETSDEPESAQGSRDGATLIGQSSTGNYVWTLNGAGARFFSEGRAIIVTTEAAPISQDNNEEVIHFTGADFLLPEAWQGRVKPEISQSFGSDERILYDGVMLMGWDSNGAQKIDEIRERIENGEHSDYGDTGTEFLPDGTKLIFGRGNDEVCSVEIIDSSGHKGYLWTFANSSFRASLGGDPEVIAVCLQLQADAAGVSADGDPHDIAMAFLRACAERLILL